MYSYEVGHRCTVKHTHRQRISVIYRTATFVSTYISVIVFGSILFLDVKLGLNFESLKCTVCQLRSKAASG